MNPKYHLAALIFIGVLTTSYSQQPQLSLRNYNTNEGLPSSEVYEILQDSRGYIWISSDNGVSRFNGYEFRNYGLTDGLSDLVVFVLREDDHGRIWMGSLSGQIFYYEPKRDSIFAFWGNQKIKQLCGQASACYDLYIDSNAVMHVSLKDYGILQFNPDSTVQIFRPNKMGSLLLEMPHKVISATVRFSSESQEGRYFFQHWHSKTKAPLVWYDKKGNSTITFLHNQSIILNAFKLKTGEVLIKTLGFLHCFRDKELLWVIPQLATNNYISFHQNAEGALIFGMDNGRGIRQFEDLEAIRQNRYETLIQGYSVSHILQDREGGYWFSTLQKGIFYCPKPEWRLYNEFSGLANNRVTSVALKNEHEWYLSLQNGHIYQINSLNKHLKNLNSPIDKCYYLLYDISHQRLWAASYPVSYWQSSQWKKLNVIYTNDPKPRPASAYYLSKDYKIDAVWGSGHNGFLKIKNDARINFHSESIGIGSERVLTILKNKDDKVWIGKLSGLYEYRTSTKQLVAPDFSHPAFSLRVDALESLPDTTLVVGTKGGGILLYKGKIVRQITQKNGLTSDIIENLHVDNNGAIWAGTLQGVNKITLKNDSFEVEKFTIAHGLPSNEVGKIVTLNGKVWVATMAGVVVFQDSYQRNPISHHPIIEVLRVNDQVVDDLRWKHLRKLRNFQNNLSLQFSSLQFRNAGNIQYRYRLLPTSDWTYTHDQKLNFAALRARRYVFEVQAQNEDGIWSNSTRLPFKIRPAWWQTHWFFEGLFFLVFGIAYFIYTKRIAAFKQETALEIQTNKLKQIQDFELAKNKMYENITHEFRTPLTSILGIADLISKNPALELKNRLTKVKENGRRLLILVNQMLDLSRLESGHLKLNPTRGDLVRFLKHIYDHFHFLAARKEIQLSFQSETEQIIMDFDAEKMQQIISNLLSNAIKFTPELGEIHLHILQQDANQVQIEVIDNGIGISEDQLPHIFNRFYQVDAPATKVTEGTGIGLAIVRELVLLMKGEIEVKSTLDKGTTFSICLLVTQEASLQEVFVDSDTLDTENIHSNFNENGLPNENTSLQNAPRILIVEDNPDVIYYLQSLFADSYQIIASKDGQEGIAKAIQYIPDLILCDIMMPRMNGIELCRALKTDIRTSHIPIVLITAKATQEDKQMGLEVGADDYLYKPFNEKELHIRIANLIANRQRLVEYFQSHGLLADYWRDKSRQESDFLKQLHQLISDKLANKIDVSYLCKSIGMSRTQLYRKLNALTGQSIGDIVRQIRLQQAKYLLQNTQTSISDISAEIGIEDVSYFNRIFKEEYGVKPSEIRKKSS